MVDVMLVLLIIFIVITPMLSKGVAVDMVKAKNPIAMQDADKEDAVLVAVARDGKVYLGNDQMPPDQLPPKVKDLLTNKLEQDRLRQGRCARADMSASWMSWTISAPPAWTTSVC